ncbi:SLC13 family permease [Thiomicrospira sp. S5]|uniref:SLC13 family permease n=1 Tax=Thiomicrospira sp. S5 TaxID=1803865 RepID=UPI000F8A14C7|nr:SLC13 family permease [Thiomicrospira sp. S5]AZR80887.1 anion transporter [Thiomicrospira sp. S5]
MIEKSQQIKGLIWAILSGLVVFAVLTPFLPGIQATLLGIVVTMVFLWSNEALPLGWVALLPIVLFPLFGITHTNEVAPNYAQSIIFLFIGGFMLAIAIEKTELHHVISQKMLAVFPATPRGMIYALSITSGGLSAFLSNTTTALLLMPLALFLTERRELQMRFALAIAYGASVGGILTPIGTPPNLILFGFFDQHLIPGISFAHWVLMVLPLVAAMFVVVGWVLALGTVNETLKTDFKPQPLNSGQKKVLYLVSALVAILVINALATSLLGWSGFNEKGLLLGFGLLLFLPPFDILNWQDTKKIPYEIIFLFGAGFAIAGAFTTTGLADQLAWLLQHIAVFPTWLVIAIIAFLVTFSTIITSNTALIAMVLPILLAVCEQSGLDSRLLMMVATVCASYAFMLPISTPPNAIAMSSGAVSVKTMATYGLAFNLLGITFVTLTANLFWQHLL